MRSSVFALGGLLAVLSVGCAGSATGDDDDDAVPDSGDVSGDTDVVPEDGPGEDGGPGDDGGPVVCLADTDCDDGVSCTTDTCDLSTGVCSHAPASDLCDDGNPCNGVERCDIVVGCIDGTPVDCDDGVSCTTDTCDPLTGSCSSTADHGACTPPQLCDPAAGGCVDPPPCRVDADCDDGDACNGRETCGGDLTCRAGTAVVCDDAVFCTADACNPIDGRCTYTPQDVACDDGNACNGQETCDAVAGCRLGTPLRCDDGFPCTVDACNPVTGTCTVTPDHTLCSDGIFCNGSEVCSTVSGCMPGAAPDCGDGIACTVDTCSAATDRCDNRPNDGACANGQFCDGAETCMPGVGCRPGTPPVCNDGIACTADSCDPGAAGGAGACVYAAADVDRDTYPDRACGGTDCDDLNASINPGISEVCNALDDNCNTAADETFACVRDTSGSCTASCGTTGTRLCSTTCSWGACTPPAETCNGRDDDCDGACDDGFACCAGISRPCATTCGSTGTEVCSGSCGWGSCTPPAEVCNGTDDDCDTLCDDGFGCCLGAVTPCSSGGCTGTAVCGAGCTAGTCNYGAAPPHDTCFGSTTTISSSMSLGFATCSANNDYTASCGGSAASPDVVYRLVLASRSNVTITTSGSSFDPVLHLHGGPGCIGSELACSDDYSGAESRIAGTWDAGTYWIVVDGFSSSNRGTGTLNVTITPAIATVTVNFPTTADPRTADYFWNTSHNVYGSRTPGLSNITQAVIHLVLGTNSISCDSAEMRFLINGVALGTFLIYPGTTVIDRTWTFAAITGPTYTLRYEISRNVASGCGSTLLNYTASTVALTGSP